MNQQVDNAIGSYEESSREVGGGSNSQDISASDPAKPAPAYTTEADIEAMARAMMRTVFHEIDVDEASLDWTGNDVWGCDFAVMAQEAIAESPVHAELERVKAENERLREALYAIACKNQPYDREGMIDVAVQALQQKGGGDE